MLERYSGLSNAPVNNMYLSTLEWIPCGPFADRSGCGKTRTPSFLVCPCATPEYSCTCPPIRPIARSSRTRLTRAKIFPIFFFFFVFPLLFSLTTLFPFRSSKKARRSVTVLHPLVKPIKFSRSLSTEFCSAYPLTLPCPFFSTQPSNQRHPANVAFSATERYYVRH